MTGSHELELREALIQTCLDMASSGLSFGTSGNASVRLDKGTLLITPSGLPYETLQPEDICALKMDGRFFGKRTPSSEWRFHRDILRSREDVYAIVHCHSPFATALACREEGIPAFHYMVAVAGGHEIRCAPYATFGTQALSDHAIAALEDRQACLLANHGQFALGCDLPSAFKMAGEVEVLATMYWRSRQGSEPKLLDKTEMNRVIEKFKTYGSPEFEDDDLHHASDTLTE